jgi:hypothetical protein
MKENHVFKFSKINKNLLDSLVHSRLHFARPETLNDPFDCQVDVKKSLKKAVEQSSGLSKKSLENLFDNEFQNVLNKNLQDLKDYGVFSASHKPSLECPLLWSHYGNEHKGICLVYSIPNVFCSPGNNGVFCILNVEYGENLLTDWFKELPSKTEIHSIAFEEMMKKILTIKSSCWKYEDEVRIIRNTSGYVSIDQSYLQHICFGLNTSEDDRKLIQKIMKKFKYDVAYSEIRRNQSDFGIVAVDIK